MTYGPIVSGGYEIHADDDEDLLVTTDSEMWPEGNGSDTVAIRPMFEIFWDHTSDCFVCEHAKSHGELIEL